MPIQVDHAERRRHVIAVTAQLLARGGVAAVTVREVARQAGYSTAVVSHYFHDKDELLRLTFADNVSGAAAVADAAIAADPGDLKGFIAPVMVLDAATTDRWRIWLAYIAQLASHPDIAAIQRDSARDRLARLRAILQHLHDEDALAEGVAPAVAADGLLSMLMGLAIQVLFDEAAWPPTRQHRVIDAALRALYRPGRLPPGSADL